MPGWLTTLSRLASAVEGGVGAVAGTVRERIGESSPARIVPYVGYGTPTRWRITARVLRNRPVAASRDEDKPLDHLVAAWRTFETDEVPHAPVRITGGGVSIETHSDSEGYVNAWLTPSSPAPSGWHDVQLTLLEPANPTPALAEVLVPSAGASFLIVSDIDDTVIRTDVADPLKMAREILLGSARTRHPFQGVAAFYRALVAGPSGQGDNPIFYVSSGPWNLYGQLVELFALRDIPRGPIILRDWGLSRTELSTASSMKFKREAIAELLQLYPTMPAIFIGDSGQQDPEIYESIVKEHPGRVLAVYIRDVTRRPERTDAIRRLADEVQTAGGVLVLVDDSSTAAQHAAKHGWIAESALPAIGAAVAEG